ncbi:MAG: peptidylprolyl isomerase [Pirellulales bacterium]|nr:peptidylprolyl isomerase [Pirellulales bacterium]
MKKMPVLFTLVFSLFASPGLCQESIEELSKKFDYQLQDWGALANQVIEQQKNGLGQDRALHQQVEELLDNIVATGLSIYRQDPKNYPRVNKTLQSLASFFVIGDTNGDGGDQYEKALPIIQAMLEAGAGNQTPEFWVWGGVSAFCTNQFDLAEKYLHQAAQTGLMQNLPQRKSSDPSIAVRQNAAGYLQSLPTLRIAWEKEKALRNTEAKADNLPRVKFVTIHGDIIIELFENEAPEAVASFLTLIKQGYYDGIVFHRVLPQFMAQGGDPTGSGSGGPGYNIRCECHGSNYRKHFRGSLSMAHAGKNTGGSQFFLTYVPTSYLDGRHTVFGRVLEGINAAARLRRRDPSAAGPHPTPDKILKAEVLRDRGHAYEFVKLPAR